MLKYYLILENILFQVVPWGFRKALNWIKDNYDNPEIVVLENGYCDTNSVYDHERVNYYRLYLNSLLDSIDDGCNITGYTAWSLMDNFEWISGYTYIKIHIQIVFLLLKRPFIMIVFFFSDRSLDYIMWTLTIQRNLESKNHQLSIIRML